MLVSTKEIFNKSYGKYGVAAVNIWDMEQKEFEEFNIEKFELLGSVGKGDDFK